MRWLSSPPSAVLSPSSFPTTSSACCSLATSSASPSRSLLPDLGGFSGGACAGCCALPPRLVGSRFWASEIADDASESDSDVPQRATAPAGPAWAPPCGRKFAFGGRSRVVAALPADPGWCKVSRRRRKLELCHGGLSAYFIIVIVKPRWKVLAH
ncbi:hypothetical protein ZWY2020_021034 [Hordeum vulgare]|nr:hypothetical protein ZWY2020_021034 [Hordeum vulgare]